MTRLKQTIFDFKSGNCWSTCIACLLDLPLGDVPNFCAEGTDTFDVQGRREDWYRRTQLWLRARGMDMVTFNWPLPDTVGMIPPEGFILVTGPSPRNPDKSHVIICRVTTDYVQTETGYGHTYAVAFEHDPHPDDAFLAGAPTEASIIVRTL